jgi:mannosyltransferase OCH1-like enzyme
MIEDKCAGDVLRICGFNTEDYIPDLIGNWWDLKQKFEITQCFCYSELRTEADFNTLHIRIKQLQESYNETELIPKIIHFFWEGSDELPAKVQRVVDTWKDTNSDYFIKRWSYKDLPDHPLLKEMYDKKMWSPLSDFARAYCIVKDGGFYFDTDLELTKSLDDLRNLRCFSSVEGNPVKLNNAACGGLPKSPFMQLVIDKFLATPIPKQVGIDPIPVVYGPGNVSKTFEARYGKLMKWHMERIFIYPDLVTLPKRIFYPYNWNEKFSDDCLKPDTHGIHLWEKSW